MSTDTSLQIHTVRAAISEAKSARTVLGALGHTRPAYLLANALVALLEDELIDLRQIQRGTQAELEARP